MDSTSTPKRPNRMGCNNPMWGRHHSTITRQKQSDAAIRRNQEYKKALDNQHHVSMEEFLSNNPTVKEYISTLVKEETDKLDKLIKEQIDKVVWRKQNQRISFPDEWT